MEFKYDSKEIKEKLTRSINNSSVCIKHPIGAIIENTDGVYVAGWNGAPTGIKHNECARKGLPSGYRMDLCVSIHAERRAISIAAKHGINLEGSTIYLNEWFPCDECAKSIIEAGIVRLVTPDEYYADKENHVLLEKLQSQSYNFEMSEKLIREAGIEVIIDPSIKVTKE
jgi:dCMP deaminase